MRIWAFQNSSLTLRGLSFLYTKLGSFTDMEYYFYQLAYWDSKVPKHFVGLNQMQCSPSFDWNWGKQNDHTACWHQLHPQFQVLQQGKCLGYPPECVGGVTETTICPPSHSCYIGQRAAKKHQLFMGLCLTPITSIWRAA